MKPDFNAAFHGEVLLLVPISERARVWALERLPHDAPRLGFCFGLDAALADRIFASLRDQGFTVAPIS